MYVYMYIYSIQPNVPDYLDWESVVDNSVGLASE